MSESWTVAVYGATGALGKEVRVGLEGLDVGFDRLIPVAGVRSAGVRVPWQGAQVPVIAPLEVDPAEVDVALFAVPRDLAAAERPKLQDRGALVVDLSGAHLSSDTPLPVLWPPLNADALERHPGGFALPGGTASTVAPLIDACAPLGSLTEVSVVELVGATDAGVAGAEALSSQTVGMLSYKAVEAAPFRDILAFNVLELTAPQGPRQARLRAELTALLPTLEARYRLTTVRIPVFSNLTLVVELRFAGPAPSDDALTAAISAHPDLDLRPEGAALRDAADHDEVLVSTPRRDDGGVVRVVLHADPLHRTGAAIGALLERVVQEDLW